jgi:hypothetical protein
MKIIAKSIAFLVIACLGSMSLPAQETIADDGPQSMIAQASEVTYTLELSIEADVTGNSEQSSLEERILLEDWMLEENFKGDISLPDLVRVEPDKPIELQKWMYCCEDWDIVRM